MKCNLDCSYCATGIYGSHDNSTKHPELSKCLAAIDVMFEYVNIKMQHRAKGLKYVVLNVYGGESLHHPDIVTILNAVRERYLAYQQSWHLTITTTTNAIVSSKKLDKIIPLIDEFTVSYHSENTPEQKQQFKDNLLAIKSSSARLKCIVMMHGDQKHFNDAKQMIEWCELNYIKYLPKQVDNLLENDTHNYNSQQIIWFEQLYQTKLDHVSIKNQKSLLWKAGRACCGGRSLCTNQQYRQPQSFVANSFKGWLCSVNEFFLHVKQLTGEVFTNKDCKMNFQGQRGPIGTLDRPNDLLQQAKNSQVITCGNDQCYCGLCAPKAENLETFTTIMKKYAISTTDLSDQTQRTN